MYCDSSLREGGFPFECDRERNRVLVVKSHRENSLKTFRRVILLIRNPYESILTFFHYRNSGHTGYTNNAKFFTGGKKYVLLRSAVNSTIETTRK